MDAAAERWSGAATRAPVPTAACRAQPRAQSRVWFTGKSRNLGTEKRKRNAAMDLLDVGCVVYEGWPSVDEAELLPCQGAPPLSMIS